MRRVENLEKAVLALTEAFARLEAAVKPNPRAEGSPTSIPPQAAVQGAPPVPGMPPELLGTLVQRFLGGGGGDPMEGLTRTILMARQIADAMNPPDPIQQLFAKAMVRQLLRGGLLTEGEAKHVLEEGGHG